MDLATSILTVLWAGGLAATPIALLVGALCRWKKLRPATRHALWLAVLASFVTPAVGRLVWRPEWSRSERILAAADTVIDRFSEPSGAIVPNPAALVMPAPAQIPAASAPVRPATNPSGVRSLEPPILSLEQGQPREAPTFLVTAPIETASFPSAPERRDTSAARSIRPLPSRPTDTRHRKFETSRESDRPLEIAAGPAPVAAEVPALPPQAGERPAADSAAISGPNVRAWVVGLVALRDAIVTMPPVPGIVWLLGAAVVVVVHGLRTLSALRLVRRARPAGGATCALVRAVGADLGLRRLPEVVVVDSTVSPMVWCGPRPKLVLPANLWRALDSESRRAVVVHELAHLKRRDHVLCWVESLIGAAYWWHPVAWWARRRLHDEAEACCDAWVTSLLPRSRRAYASALLATKSYLSVGEKGRGPSGAGPWLGVMSGSARKLARRITMVMTQRTAPKVSVFGACVAVLVVAAGTFVTPTIACPPEEGQKKASATAPAAVIVRRGDRGKAPSAESPAVRFFGEAPALDAMRDGQSPIGVAVPAAPQPPEPSGTARAPRAPKPPKAPRPGAFMAPSAPAAPAQGVDLDSLKVGRTVRVYHLSDGKRDAFWQLMSRSDVPVLVEMRDDGIAVYARDNEHPAIEAFVRMIDPGTGAKRSAVRGAAGVAFSGDQLRAIELNAARQGAAGAYSDALKSYAQSRATLERDVALAQIEAERVNKNSEYLSRAIAGLSSAGSGTARAAEPGALLKRYAEHGREVESSERSLSELLSRLETRLAELAHRVADLEGDDDEADHDEDIDIEDVDVDFDDAEAPADEEFEVIEFEGAGAFATSPNPFDPAMEAFTAAWTTGTSCDAASPCTESTREVASGAR